MRSVYAHLPITAAAAHIRPHSQRRDAGVAAEPAGNALSVQLNCEQALRPILGLLLTFFLGKEYLEFW